MTWCPGEEPAMNAMTGTPFGDDVIFRRRPTGSPPVRPPTGFPGERNATCKAAGRSRPRGICGRLAILTKSGQIALDTFSSHLNDHASPNQAVRGRCTLASPAGPSSSPDRFGVGLTDFGSAPWPACALWCQRKKVGFFKPIAQHDPGIQRTGARRRCPSGPARPARAICRG